MIGSDLSTRFVAFFVLALSLTRFSAADPDHPLHFVFGAQKAHGDAELVQPTMNYLAERGFGFEPPGKVSAVEDANGGYCTSDKPFYFSVKLPEGNYNVTLKFGDTARESATTVKAELRRLMLENLRSVKAELLTRTITINIRQPQFGSDGEVRLKDREKTSEIWNWDDKLTLGFSGARPCLREIQIVPAPQAPTVYLLGDSTVCDQPSEPWNSWGQVLPRFFKPGIAVANHAQSGESLRSSLAAKRLDKVLSTMKPADYLFIQYGHNDQKERGPNVGAMTTYKSDLRYFVQEAKKHGGIPILVTSMNRRTFDSEGHIMNSLGDYPEAVRQLAREENVPLIDLHAMSKQFYEAMGSEESKHAFVDNTHHNDYGSYELAKCIVQGIKDLKLDLSKFIVDDFGSFDPSHPDPDANP